MDAVRAHREEKRLQTIQALLAQFEDLLHQQGSQLVDDSSSDEIMQTLVTTFARRRALGH